MILKNYGITVTRDEVAANLETTTQGTELKSLVSAAQKLGLEAEIHKLTLSELTNFENITPSILHWRKSHFVVLTKIRGGKFYIADPAASKDVVFLADMQQNWAVNDGKGVLIAFSKNSAVPHGISSSGTEPQTAINFNSILKYIFRQRKAVYQVFLSLIVASFLQFIAPFLTKSVVDVGVNTKDLDFITIILFAQIAVFVGRSSIEFLRGWILLHLSTRVNLQLVYNFLSRLIRLPVLFFENKRTGDILQRMGDQNKIEQFLTNTSLNTLFSTLNFVIMSFVLAMYDIPIFLVFVVAVTLYSGWIFYFQDARKVLNYEIFDASSRNQSKVIQLINGLKDIKIYNCEREKLGEWMTIQKISFKLGLKNMAINQYQQAGGILINEGKNILITFMSAKGVIEGNLTFGTMLAIQYIIGQLNSPIEQLVGFVRSRQDAKLSLERLNEVYSNDPEDAELEEKPNLTLQNKSITFENLSFSYPNSRDRQLEDISLTIPSGRITAIVGSSGSGKTTLLKLLIKFYKPTQGTIYFGRLSSQTITASQLRSRMGVVLQDSYIFADSILRNVALGSEDVDEDQLYYALKTANILDFVQSLPMGLSTVIGSEGVGISQGQRQRILIARAIYKNPDVVLLDEATNALDSINEKAVVENLASFFANKTVVVVAHRLSTVINADQIIVMENGRVVEQGTHHELIRENGSYFQLVQNQLNLQD